MLIILVLAFSQILFAQEPQVNPITKSIATACGSKVDNPAETEEIDELASCYQEAIKRTAIGRITPLKMADTICTQFKKSSYRQLMCLVDFRNELKSQLTKNPEYNVSQFEIVEFDTVFEKCKSQAVTVVTCLKSKQGSCEDPSQAAMSCIKKERENFSPRNNTEAVLSVAQKNNVNSIIYGCGKSEAIASTSISPSEIIGMVNCYQTGLIGNEKSRVPTTAKLSLDLCHNFQTYSQKIECFKRIADKTAEADVKNKVLEVRTKKLETDTLAKDELSPEELKKVGELDNIVQKCLRNPTGNAKKSSYSGTEAHYEKVYNCIVPQYESYSPQKKGLVDTVLRAFR